MVALPCLYNPPPLMETEALLYLAKYTSHTIGSHGTVFGFPTPNPKTLWRWSPTFIQSWAAQVPRDIPWTAGWEVTGMGAEGYGYHMMKKRALRRAE